jgi:heme-binding NEAT domain protein
VGRGSGPAGDKPGPDHAEELPAILPPTANSGPAEVQPREPDGQAGPKPVTDSPQPTAPQPSLASVVVPGAGATTPKQSSPPVTKTTPKADKPKRKADCCKAGDSDQYSSGQNTRKQTKLEDIRSKNAIVEAEAAATIEEAKIAQRKLELEAERMKVEAEKIKAETARQQQQFELEFKRMEQQQHQFEMMMSFMRTHTGQPRQPDVTLD